MHIDPTTAGLLGFAAGYLACSWANRLGEQQRAKRIAEANRNRPPEPGVVSGSASSRGITRDAHLLESECMGAAVVPAGAQGAAQ